WVQQAQGTSVADAGDGRSPVYPLLQSEQVHAGSDTGRQVRRKDIGTGRTARTAPVKRKEGGQEAPHYPRRSFATRSTYYNDPHELAGKCDFVMANPPFNVDEVDAEKVKNDKRLPFGLPGVNKTQKVSNANYLWMSYFYSYLNETGRAGVVMSSQASSANRDEATVRQNLVET